MGFAIPKFTDVQVRSVNVRAEMHGQDPVPAVDIGLRLKGSNDLLDGLDPALKPMFFEASNEPEATPELDGIEPISNLRVLRTTVLKPIALTREYTGMALEIDFGLGGKSNLVLADCGADGFRVTLIEGGSVDIEFRVRAAGLDSPTLGRIGALVRHTVQAMLTGPAVDQADLGDASNVIEAGDAFAAANDPAAEPTTKPAKKPTSFKARAKSALKKHQGHAARP